MVASREGLSLGHENGHLASISDACVLPRTALLADAGFSMTNHRPADILEGQNTRPQLACKLHCLFLVFTCFQPVSMPVSANLQDRQAFPCIPCNSKQPSLSCLDVRFSSVPLHFQSSTESNPVPFGDSFTRRCSSSASGCSAPTGAIRPREGRHGCCTAASPHYSRALHIAALQ